MPGAASAPPRPVRSRRSPPLFDAPDRPGVARAEGVEPIRMDLADVGRRVHGAGDDDRHAVRAAAPRDGDRVGEVLRAVGEARRRRPHRGGQDDRLRRRQHALQEIRRLLERVGAVRDDDPTTSGRARSARRAPASRRQVAKSMSLLSICATCSLSRREACGPGERGHEGRDRHRAGRYRRSRRPTPRCRRWCRRCRERRGSGAALCIFAENWIKIQRLDVCSAQRDA